MIFEVKNTEIAAPLFEGCQETIVWSCLQGVMGHIYTVGRDNLVSAMAMLGDFCFFAGKPDRELVSFKPGWCYQEFMIMVPPDSAWEELILACYPKKAKKVVRYAIRKEPAAFDYNKFEQAVRNLPDTYVIRMIDEELFARCRESWCRDFVSQYADYGRYQEYGLGAVILKDGEIVSGASSYSGYRGGIEIEVDTKEGFRRRGLAYACCAKLLLECRRRGLYASWDAQNKWSVGLAEKLGYHYSHDYAAYEIWGY